MNLSKIFRINLALALIAISTLTPGISSAQHPLVGVWEMISAKGKGADGESFALDSTTTKEIKIITAKHYILIASDRHGDSLAFNRSYAGTLKLDGNRYIETPLFSSNTIFDGVVADFKWKLSNGKFIQSGTIVRPDGKKIILEEMVFHKINEPTDKYGNIGAWNLLTTSYSVNGQPGAISGALNRLYVLTPEHWMLISNKNGKFEYVVGGKYSIEKGTHKMKMMYASVPVGAYSVATVTHVFNNNNLKTQGEITAPDGRTTTWNDVYQKAE